MSIQDNDCKSDQKTVSSNVINFPKMNVSTPIRVNEIFEVQVSQDSTY